MMLLPILLIVFIAATPLGYAVYRAWKLAELERMARLWDGQRLGRLAESIDLDRPLLPSSQVIGSIQLSDDTMAGLDALTQAMAAAKVFVMPPESQPEYEGMLPAPADWKPGE